MGKPNIKTIKENKKTIHPHSRKAKKVNKQILRELKMEKKKSQRNMKLQILGDKLFWFKNNMDPDKEYTPQDVSALIQMYINRNMEELEQIRLKQSIGNRKKNQHASRESTINIAYQQEMKLFRESGFETVDFFDPENMKSIKSWSGELRFLPNIKLRKYKKGDLESSSFNKDLPTKSKEEMVEDNIDGAETSEGEEDTDEAMDE